MLPSHSSAQGFEAQSIELRIGYSAGGGYDRFGRLVASHIGKHLPGSPTIVPKNEPGGGSLKLTKLVIASTLNDGSLLALANPSMATISLLMPDSADFDPTKLTWIGSLTKTSSLCVTSKASGIATMEDFLSKEFILGATGKFDATYQFAALVKRLFGAKYRIVTGYPGSNDIMLAADRGEVQGRCGTSWVSLKRSAFRDKVNMIGQIATSSPLELEGIPLFIDRIENNEAQVKAAEFLMKPLAISYPLFAPPGLSDEQAKTLRAAFDAMTADPEFRYEAERLGLDLDPTSGEGVQELVRQLNSVSMDIVERAKELVR
jgi:tripartite-type tricarboxylate transporter receptor subunit TctC